MCGMSSADVAAAAAVNFVSAHVDGSSAVAKAVSDRLNMFGLIGSGLLLRQF